MLRSKRRQRNCRPSVPLVVLLGSTRALACSLRCLAEMFSRKMLVGEGAGQCTQGACAPRSDVAAAVPGGRNCSGARINSAAETAAATTHFVFAKKLWGERPARRGGPEAYVTLFSCARISGYRTSAQSPLSSSARIASVSSYSPRAKGCNFAVHSKMLDRKA